MLSRAEQMVCLNAPLRCRSQGFPKRDLGNSYKPTQRHSPTGKTVFCSFNGGLGVVYVCHAHQPLH